VELWAEKHIITVVDVDSAQNAEAVQGVSARSVNGDRIVCETFIGKQSH